VEEKIIIARIKAKIKYLESLEDYELKKWKKEAIKWEIADLKEIIECI
jgi:ferredoxin-fold anticodon binding domain-containing protein